MNWKLLILWFIAAENVVSQKCPNHWMHRPGSSSCYRFWSSVPRTWQQANDVCTMSGGNLLRFESDEEKDFIINAIKKYPPSHEWWIGLKRSPDNDTMWQWADDGSVRDRSYIYWGSGEPNNYRSSEDCAEIWDNLLNDKDCNQQLQSICERSIDTPVKCDIDRGWDYLSPGTCYKYFQQPKTIDQARKKCEVDFSQLISFKNASDHLTVSEILQEHNNLLSWVDKASTYTTSTDTGGVVMTTQQSTVQRTCLLLNSSMDLKNNMDNVPCNETNRFFCMKPEGVCSVPGSLQFESNCIIVTMMKATIWSDADSYCNLRGMRLLELTSKYYLLFLHSKFPKIIDVTDAGRSFWLGLRGSANISSWQSGRQFGEFETGIMKQVTGNGCALMKYNDDKWAMSNCGIPRDIICTIPYAEEPKVMPTEMSRYECPPGYSHVGNKCYHLRHVALDWFSARAECQREGGNLATVHSRDEHISLFGMIKKGTWIGLSDVRQEGIFEWSNSGKRPQETYWYKNNPTGRIIGGLYSENCVSMIYSPGTTGHGRWTDNPCLYRRPYICETIAELNIAYGRSTNQSSVANRVSGPGKAIDGCTDIFTSSKCCAITNIDLQPWLQLDLGSDYPIGKIVIHRKYGLSCPECKTMYNTFQLFVSNSSMITNESILVYQDKTNNVLPVVSIIVQRYIRGRYIRIQIPERRISLAVCELQVFPVSMVADVHMTPSNSNCYSKDVPYLKHLSQTISGRTCQKWVDDFPQRHSNHDDSRFPDGSQAKAENYCRDPDGEGMPWCYTMDESVRWELCPVKTCHTTNETEGSSDDDGDCGKGWNVDAITGSCFSLGTMTLTWEDAETSCRQRGGHLSTAVGSHTKDYSRFFPPGTTELWLGFYGSNSDVQWEAVDGSITTIKPTGALSGPADSNCVYMDKVNGLKIGTCVERKQYLCHKRGSVLTYTSNGDKQFIPIKSPQGKYTFDESVLKFEFKGKNSAIIVLQKELGNRKSNTYEITLCGFMNTKSFIKVTDDSPQASSDIRNLCSGKEYRSFWILWSDGVIKVGKGNTESQNMFMMYRTSDEQKQPYKYVSIRTDNVSGQWKIKQVAPTPTVTEETDVNIALKKPTEATPDHSSIAVKENVVDGCVQTSHRSGCCYHSVKAKDPWWQVDLGRVYPIKKVVVIKRWACEPCRIRIAYFRLRISQFSHSTSADDIVYVGNDPQDPAPVIDTTGIYGRYVKIDLQKKTLDYEGYAVLELCEVQVILDQDVAKCGPSWKSHLSTDVCYLFYNKNKMNWHAARNFCQAHGADLAVVRSAEEQLFIFEHTESLKDNKTYVGGFWLGYHDNSQEGHFETVDGSQVTFTDWGPGEPNDYANGEDCTSLRADMSRLSGAWNDSPCGSQLYFICKKSANPTTTTVKKTTQPVTVTTPVPTTTEFVPSNKSCETGWSRLEGSNACYQVNIEPITFYDAYKKCLVKGARLTDIPEHLTSTFTDYLRSDPKVSGRRWGSNDGLFTAGIMKKTSVPPGSTAKPSWKWFLYKSKWNTKWDSQLKQDLGDLDESCSVVTLQKQTIGNLIDFPCELSYAKGYVCKRDELDVQCEDGWFMDARTQLCYKVSSEALSWDAANKKCATTYAGTLASLRNYDDVNFFLVMLHGLPHVWVGAHDQFVEGTWEWVDHTTWSSTLPWAKNQPDNWRTNEHCGMLLNQEGTRKLNDGFCTSQYKYVCKKYAAKVQTGSDMTTSIRTTKQTIAPLPTSEAPTFTTTSKTTTVKVTDVQPRWKFIQSINVSHLYSNELVTWAQAKQNCLDYGGDLASIRSIQEATLIDAYLISTMNGEILPEQGIWIGLNSLDDTGLWQWTDGSPVAYFQFDSDYPTNRDEHQCVAAKPVQFWRDYSCEDFKPYLCTRRNDSVAEQKPDFSSERSCPGKPWRRYLNDCFLVVEDAGTWSDAVSACSDHNAKLATVSSKEEQLMIFDNLPHDTYCFNIHDNDTECAFWAESGECSHNPVWMSTHCHKACNLCMHNCNDKYESSEKCKGWMQKGECDKNPSWMIYNCAESCGICQGAPNRGFWLGLHTTTTGSYTWFSDDPVTFTNWDVKQPRSYARKRFCTAMFLSTGKWNEGPCEQTLPGYVCKTPAEVPSASTERYPIASLYETPTQSMFGIHGTYQEVTVQCLALGGDILTPEEFNDIPPDYRGGQRWLKSADTGSHVRECRASRAERVIALPCDEIHWAICQVPRFKPSTNTGSTVATTTQSQSCAQDWYKFKNKCYRIIGLEGKGEERHPWHVAKRICDDIGASMISLHSAEESDFIQGLVNMDDFAGEDMWLGLHASSNEERVFTWSDGSEYDYQNWQPGEPNNIGGSELCADFRSPDKSWNDIDCKHLKPYICQAPAGKPVSSLPPPTVYEKCDGDWFKYNDSCYLMVRTSHVWKDALENCRSMGADLASIHSHDERLFLQRLMAKEDFLWSLPWIGYNDIDLQGTWQWSDGSSPDFIGWSPGEPNSKWFNEQCGTLAATVLLRDDSCSQPRNSLCKFYNGSVVTVNTAAPVTSDLPKGCPPDFYSFGDRCFYFGTTKLNFDSARDDCFNRSSTLASIHSQQEQDFLFGQLLSGAAKFQQSARVWIGLIGDDYGDYGETHWVDHSSLGFSLLNTDQSYYSYTYFSLETECGYIKSAGEWDYATCTDENMYLCSRYQSPEFADVTTTVDPYKQCPPGYGNIGYNCLRYIESAQSWNESQSLCQRDNASLASIANDIEFSQVRLALVNLSNSVWFGGYFSQITGFHWISTRDYLKVNIPWEDNISDGYLYYNTNGKFNTANPASKRAAMCMIRNKPPYQVTTISPPTTTSSIIHDCRNDSWSFRGNCYIVVTKEKKTFANAIKTCSQYGMMLASIHSLQENKAVMTYVNKKQQHIGELYIGYMKHRNTPALWLDRSEVDFSPNLLNEVSGKPCTVLSFLDSQWFHVPCKLRLGFICKGKPDVLYVTKKTEDTTTWTIPVLPGKLDTKPDITDSTADSSLSGSEVAGIVVGIVLVITLVIVGLYMLRGMMLKKDFYMMDPPSRGFENALFQKQEDTVSLDK